MRPTVLFLFALAALAGARPGLGAEGAAAPIIGSARSAVVFDGDSFDFAGRHVQLAGIDAPELGQRCEKNDEPAATCGLTAAYELRKRLQLDPRPLRCWPESETAEATVLATCAAGETDLALVLVESGYAWTLPDAQIDYRLAEETARDSGIGLWAEPPMPPWEWRAGVAKAGARSPQQGCVIAATIDPSGERLYFGPLDPDYAAKGVDPARGERWFCSDEEARDAGWRRPGEQSPS